MSLAEGITPLTELQLAVDRKVHGWLDRAARDGIRLLASGGRPQIAAHLEREFARNPSLETLQACLRLNVFPGQAGPRGLTPESAMLGPLDGSRCTPGLVPQNPSVGTIQGWRPLSVGWTLSCGPDLIHHNSLPLDEEHFALCCDRVLPGGGVRRVWEHELDLPWVYGASDGVNLAALMNTNEGGLGLHLFDQASGRCRWGVGLTKERSRDCPTTLVAVSGNRVVTTEYEKSNIVALDVETGEMAWHKPLPPGGGYFWVIGETLCVIVSGRLHLLAMETGRTIHTQALNNGNLANIWGTRGTLYLAMKGGVTLAIDVADGRSRTVIDFLSHPHKTMGRVGFGGVATDGRIAVLTTGDTLCAVDLEHGYREIWRQSLAPVKVRGEERLFVVGEAVIRANQDELEAYVLASGTPLWAGVKAAGAPVYLWGHPHGLLAQGADGAHCWIREAGADS